MPSFVIDSHGARRLDRPSRTGRAAVLCLGAAVGGAVVAPACAEPSPAASMDSHAAPFDPAGGFDGARLGMSLAQWRALPSPRPDDPHVRVVCDPRARGEAGDLVCRYGDVYRRLELPQAMALGHLRAWKVRYGFTDGRLVSIRLRASIDAYSAVMADLSRAYGKPVRTLVDRTTDGRARVRAVWRRADDRIELTDPSPNPARLEVAMARQPSTGHAVPSARSPSDRAAASPH